MNLPIGYDQQHIVLREFSSVGHKQASYEHKLPKYVPYEPELPPFDFMTWEMLALFMSLFVVFWVIL